MNLNKTAKNLLNNSFILKLFLPYNCKKLMAFTLAEVLITLLIIGVVASLVVPALIQNTQQAEYIVAWKKAYGIIFQTQLNMVRDYGSVSGAFSNIDNTPIGGNNFMNSWLHYLSITKICSAGRIISDGCHTKNFVGLDGNIMFYNSGTHEASVILNDGTFINFYSGMCDGGSVCSDSNLFIDVNGVKGPNIVGRDVFRMRYIPQKDRFIAGNGADATCSGTGWNCGAYYLSH